MGSHSDEPFTQSEKDHQHRDYLKRCSQALWTWETWRRVGRGLVETVQGGSSRAGWKSCSDLIEYGKIVWNWRYKGMIVNL